MNSDSPDYHADYNKIPPAHTLLNRRVNFMP